MEPYLADAIRAQVWAGIIIIARGIILLLVPLAFYIGINRWRDSWGSKELWWRENGSIIVPIAGVLCLIITLIALSTLAAGIMIAFNARYYAVLELMP